MSGSSVVLDFSDERCLEVPLSGGKGASLSLMTRVGLPVPPGFVVTSSAFVGAVDVEQLLHFLEDGNVEGARAVVARGEPPREQIKTAYDQLPEGESVAVRSSACAEDGSEASYAGQQESYLFVETFDLILDKIVECWLSFFSERALFYRQHKGDLRDVQMAVVVQQMVDAEYAGVMFTVDPVNHRRDRIVIEAARGVGEHVVSGEITPDYYTLDRTGTLKKARVVNEQVLNAAELEELVKMGLHLEELNNCPQDIEWAYDSRGLHLLQSRPITTL